MNKLTYCVEQEDREREIEWLRDQRIYPVMQNIYDWEKNKSMIRIGVIVNNEMTVFIKLRHQVELQTNYK